MFCCNQTFLLFSSIERGPSRPRSILENRRNVEWQLVGSAKQYWVDFVNGAPFGGASRRDSNNNGKIQVIIYGDAGPEGYKYDIGLVDGGLLDPRIIIGE